MEDSSLGIMWLRIAGSYYGENAKPFRERSERGRGDCFRQSSSLLEMANVIQKE